jgi:hypothetical protein
MTNENDALNTSQINRIMESSKDFYGTYPKDHFYKVLHQIKPKSRGGAILNLDTSDENGSHWVAIYWDARQNGSQTIEYCDSFGRQPPHDIMNDLQQLKKKLEADNPLKLKINRIQRQDKRSVSCGYFCINFILNRLRGKSFKSASGFNSIDKNEEHMENLKEKFNFML